MDDQTEAGRRRAHINRNWSPRDEDGDPDWPVENFSRILYHEIGSENDPPQSVALCPRRQCVAFGCFSGLELHWVDYLSGQNLTRWFPMSMRCDHVYFISPRSLIDSPRKLRIISSASLPNERVDIAVRYTAYRNLASGTPSLVAGSIEIDPPVVPLPGPIETHDHYHALPLSDGQHFLFVDADSSMLCMGIDASRGGARGLMRKIMLVPPTESALALLYAPAFDTSTGPKIAVGYGDEIMFYSIPGDVFAFSSREHQAGRASEDSFHRSLPWQDWWPEDDIPARRSPDSDDTENPAAVNARRPLWPVFVRGTSVGRLSGLSDLAVNTSGGRLTIWAFASNGDASVWRVDDGTPQASITERRISKSGQVLRPYRVDADGDVVMEDSPHATDDYFSGGSHGAVPSFVRTDAENNFWDPRWDED